MPNRRTALAGRSDAEGVFSMSTKLLSCTNSRNTSEILSVAVACQTGQQARLRKAMQALSLM